MRFVLAVLSFVAFLPASALAELTIDELIAEARLEEGETPVRDLDGWKPPKTILGPASLVATIEKAFPDIEFIAAGSRSEAAGLAERADVILSWCDAEIVDASTRVRWVQIFSAGAERCLNTQRILSKAVLLTNGQKMSSPAIGEHAIAMTLALSRDLVQYGKRMPTGEWGRDQDIDTISGKTMLVAGLGGIGSEAAKRAHALGMRVIATRNSSRRGPDYVDYVGLSHELFELAQQADVVVNALPLTDKTAGLFDEAFFDAVKPGVIFVNVARGGSVVTDDLVAALKSGRVSAAGLDVTDPEPLPADHPLWQMENVLITPHIAWAGTDRSRVRLLAIENLRRYIAGDKLLNVVDPDAGY
jgi:phosphoglycerate dehydrogenase-like enzyme